MTTQSKTCNKCGEEKPLEQFPKRAEAPDGRRAECRKCYTRRQMEWRRKNRDKYNRYQRQYRKDRKESKK